MKLFIGIVLGFLAALGWVYLPPTINIYIDFGIVIIVMLIVPLIGILYDTYKLYKIEKCAEEKRDADIESIHQYLVNFGYYRDKDTGILVQSEYIRQEDFYFFYLEKKVHYKGIPVDYTPSVAKKVNSLLDFYATKFKKKTLDLKTEAQDMIKELTNESKKKENTSVVN